jgi:hypothetical protein
VVQSDVLDIDEVGVHGQVVAEPTLGPDGHIAEADSPMTFVEQGLGDDADGIGEVDEPGAGIAPLRRFLGQRQNGGNRAQSLGQAACPGGLLPEAPVTDRQRLIDMARRLSADAQLDDDEIGSFQRGVLVRCR